MWVRGLAINLHVKGINDQASRMLIGVAMYFLGIASSVTAATQYVTFEMGVQSSWELSYALSNLFALLFLMGTATMCRPRGSRGIADWLNAIGIVVAGWWMGHSVVIHDLVSPRGMIVNNLLMAISVLFSVWFFVWSVLDDPRFEL